MKTIASSATAVFAVLAVAALSGCPAPTRTSGNAESGQAPAEPADDSAQPAETPESDLEIDIGDITYGVYASVEFFNENVRPNVEIERLSSRRFDHRPNSVTVTITPPHPETMPIAILLGSTRYLPGHTVRMRVHVYRQYEDSGGKTRTDEIRTFDQVLGEDRYSVSPYVESVDVYAGLEQIPKSMLVICELEAWLFKFTDVNTFDAENADYKTAEYKKYNGYNPLRINLIDRESGE